MNEQTSEREHPTLSCNRQPDLQKHSSFML